MESNFYTLKGIGIRLFIIFRKNACQEVVMIKEIAMYINSFGEIADLNNAGLIRIFSKDKNKWNVVKDKSFEFHTIQKKDNIRLNTLNITEALENCKVFVAKEIPDLVYMILDSIGVSVWKMDGEQDKILKYVSEKEEEEEKEIKLINPLRVSDKKERTSPIQIGHNGHYIMNLKEIQKHNTGITTKQVLRPFLNNNKFTELIITCLHVPNWLISDLKRLNLNFEFSKAGDNDFVIVINHHLELN